MARPDIYPEWALNTINDPVTGSTNREQPDTDKIDYGQAANQNTLRQDINYLFFKCYEWIKYFDEQEQPDDVVMVSDDNETLATVVNTIETQRGGTWVLVDGGASDPTTTIAGQGMYVLKKTA
jgi:hypothetical protein